MAKPRRCPACKKEVGKSNPSFPFCSERCKLVDLGRWLGGEYRIASREPAQAEEEKEREVEKEKG